MKKLFYLWIAVILFESFGCVGHKTSGVASWEYINTSKAYIPYDKLKEAIDNSDLPGFDKSVQGAVGWDLEGGKGTIAGAFCYLKGSPQQQHPQFNLNVYDSVEKVNSLLSYSGEVPFEITGNKGDLIYAQYKNKTSRYHCLILIKNRLLLDFTAHQIDIEGLHKVCTSFNTSEFERLLI